MNYKLLFYVLLSLLVLFVTLSVVFFISTIHTFKSKVNEINEVFTDNMAAAGMFEQQYKSMLTYKSKCGELGYVKNLNGENVYLKDLLRDNVLILRFNEFACDDCIYKTVDNLIKTELLQNVLFFITNSNFQKAKIFLKKAKIPQENCYLVEEDFNCAVAQLENKNMPYFYTIRNSEINDVFVVNTGSIVIMKDYLMALRSFFMNSNLNE